MKVYYCDHYVLPLPDRHRFPMDKYRMLRERVEQCNVGQYQLLVPDPASDDEILLAHAAGYLDRVVTGSMGARELRELGFPWSGALVERSRRSSGGTIAACRAACADGAGANLAGGTHHAFGARAQGYCVFNDSAIASRVMQREGRATRILIVDCDVHQGNGTAAIFAQDPTVFTLSLHGARNFPTRKESSDLDIALPDGTDDAAYLQALDGALACALERSQPDLVIYVAGADPYRQDRLGRLNLSKSGLAARDALVYEYCRQWGLPVAVIMGGGYADDVNDIVDIHYHSVAQAAKLVIPVGV
jgi:acetoin utilization deacetylase AcuC-like enzyme